MSIPKKKFDTMMQAGVFVLDGVGGVRRVRNRKAPEFLGFEGFIDVGLFSVFDDAGRVELVRRSE
jgi:hypothetical protein